MWNHSVLSMTKICLDVRESAHKQMRTLTLKTEEHFVTILFTMVLQVLNPLLVLIFIPLFDLVIYRLVSKCGINFS